MINARELASWPKEKLWEELGDAPVKVMFDDGVVESTGRATIYSAYMWDLYALYPKTPALKRHHLGGDRVGANTHLNLLGAVMFDCFEAYGEKLDIEELCRIVYQATNRIYNDFTYRLEAHVKTLSIKHFIEVLHHPLIRAANDSVQPNRLSIEKTYSIIEKVLRDPKELVGNPIANAAKNGLVDMRQIRQCVGPRGVVTDIDSNFFRDPILRSYTHGLRSLQNSMMESRSASKSLVFTEDPLRDSEYFNRELQLLCATLEFLHKGDCGSQEYLSWRVRPGDLKALAGKFYLTDGGGLQRVKTDDRHLVGEVIQMRSVLYCHHKDPRGICTTCFGDMALSIPRDTNVGHVSAVALCEQVSQSVLSVKHVDSASGMEGIELSEYEQQFLKVGTDSNTLALADRLEKKRVIMTISSKEAPQLADILFVDDVRTLPISRISELTDILLNVIGTRGDAPEVLNAAQGSRKASMTHDLLAYIKVHGWDVTAATGDYAIDLSAWDMELPILELPRKHENMLDYMKTIRRFIRGTDEDGSQSTLADCHSLEQALMEFHILVSSQLSVNIAHLEVILKAATIRSAKDRDYRLPLAGNKVEFGSFSDTMAMRSLSVAMAHQGHKKIINTPASYIYDKRPSHPLDAIMVG